MADPSSTIKTVPRGDFGDETGNSGKAGYVGGGTYPGTASATHIAASARPSILLHTVELHF